MWGIVLTIAISFIGLILALVLAVHTIRKDNRETKLALEAKQKAELMQHEADLIEKTRKEAQTKSELEEMRSDVAFIMKQFGDNGGGIREKVNLMSKTQDQMYETQGIIFKKIDDMNANINQLVGQFSQFQKGA